MKNQILHDHKELSRTALFWLAMLIPMLFATLIASSIFLSLPSGSICFTTECWVNFVRIYKVPITIAGLSIPAVAIVAALHRSHETAIQISMSLRQYEEAVSNNRFGNFLKHREGFIKHLDGVILGLEHKGIKCNIDSGALYHSVFPKNGFEGFEWASDVNLTTWVNSQVLLSNLSGVFSKKEPPSDEAFLAAMKALSKLQRVFNFRYSTPARYQLSAKEGIYYIFDFPNADNEVDHDTNVAISVVSTLEIVRKIASFCFVDLDISKFEAVLNVPDMVDFIAEIDVAIEDYDE